MARPIFLGFALLCCTYNGVAVASATTIYTPETSDYNHLWAPYVPVDVDYFDLRLDPATDWNAEFASFDVDAEQDYATALRVKFAPYLDR